jgi:hypothetical protein
MTPTKDTPIINGSWDSPAPNMVDRWAKPKDTPHPGKNILVDRVEYTPKETLESRWKAFLFDNSICDGSCSNPDCGGKQFPEILAFIAQELELAKREVAREVIEKIKEWTIKSMFHGNVEELDCLNELLDLLATLREKEGGIK